MNTEEIKDRALKEAEMYETEKEKFAFVCGALFGATKELPRSKHGKGKYS